jgi:hypothetical protein
MRTIDIFVRDRNGLPIPGASIDFFLNGAPAGQVPISEGRGRIEDVGPGDSVEVLAKFGGEQKRVKLGPQQNSFTFNFEVDMDPPRPKVQPDLIDAFIILLLAAAIDIFVFAMATQFINSPIFQKLPGFITDAYSAIWSSIVAGGAGIGAAILKALTRPAGSQTPNYLFYAVFTALGLIFVILGLAFVALLLPKN